MSRISTKWIEDAAVDKDKLNTDVAGDGITGGGGSALAVDTTVIRTNGANDFTANQNMGGFLLVNLGAPTADTDAVRKGYVDDRVSGVDYKHSVTAATDAALAANTPAGSGVGKTLTADSNGALSVDGVSTFTDMDNDSGVNDPFDPTGTLASRILVKNESGVHNGIYAVKDKGSAGTPWILVRAVDADEDYEVTAGMTTFADQGTANSERRFSLVSDDAVVVDTDAQSFTASSGLGQVTAGAGLTKTGDQIDVGDVNKGVQVNADDVQVDASEIAGDGLKQTAGGGNEHLLTVEVDNTGGQGDAIGVGSSGVSIDGDKVDIDWTPTNYTPDATPSEADDADDLTAHLAGIDTAIGAATVGDYTVEFHLVTAGENTAGVFTLAGTPLAVSEVKIDPMNGPGQMNAANEPGGETPDFEVVSNTVKINGSSSPSETLSGHIGVNDVLRISYFV